MLSLITDHKNKCQLFKATCGDFKNWNVFAYKFPATSHLQTQIALAIEMEHGNFSRKWACQISLAFEMEHAKTFSGNGHFRFL